MKGNPMLLLLVAVCAFIAGTGIGAFVMTRNAHRLVARLPLAEQVAFAKKVSATRR